MGTHARLLELLHPLAEGRRVRKVQIGLVYSAAELDGGAVGVAYTFPNTRFCQEPSGPGRYETLAGRGASELLAFPGEKGLLRSSLSMAVANALLASLPLASTARTGDILEAVEICPGDRVVMVGCFIPLLQALEQKQVSVSAVDEVPKPGSSPPEEARRLLPRCQVAILTATSIINGTIDELLELSTSCREVVVLGPSTPLLPQAFAGTPVTCLSGIRVSHPEAVMGCIAEGGGFREFKRFTRKWNLRIHRG